MYVMSVTPMMTELKLVPNRRPQYVNIREQQDKG